MAILGLFTDVGIEKSIDAANDEGFFIFPEEFGVSDQSGALDASRTGANIGLFYQAAISSRTVVDQNTVKVVGTVPPELIPEGTTKEIKEIYIFAKDSDENEFLLALGQPTTTVLYDPERSVTLELEISLTNIDLSENFIFSFTQATEISEHNSDPNAHPEIIEEMNRAGQFLLEGGAAFDYAGQTYDKNAEFDGTKSSFTHEGVTFTATFNGDEIDGEDIVFDGIKDVDTIRAEFNAANFPFTVEHDGAGTEVLTATTKTLTGGGYNVADDDIVYRDVDDVYKKALADGTIKSQVAGVASVTNRLVMSGHGALISIATGFSVGTDLFLSESSPGQITDSDTSIKLGFVIDDTFIRFSPEQLVEGLFQGVDAVVSNLTGFNFYSETQDAIDNVPNNGYILVDKLELLQETLDSSGKTLNFIFNGDSKGWKKAEGVNEEQLIEFSAVPDAGTWRIEWNGQETIDLAFNATALDVENAFNALAGHNGVSVTGDYSTGFTISYDNDFLNLPEPTFTDPGQKEIQRFTFGNIPDDGTWQLEHDGNASANHAFNDTAGQLETLIEAISSIDDDITVTGSFASQQFDIQWETLEPQTNLTVIMSDLELSSTTTTINGFDPTVTLPIDPTIVQEGKYPANNLSFSASPVNITVTETQQGSEFGAETAIILDAPNSQFVGRGTIEGFSTGIDLNGQTGTRIDMNFVDNDVPILSEDLEPGVDFNAAGSIGFAPDVNVQLALQEHPTDKKKVVVSEVDFPLVNGGILAQTINQLKLKFTGAIIDLVTGEVFEEDGVTPLGTDFTPPTIATGMWRWISVAVIPDTVDADNTMVGKLKILVSDTDGATQATAKRPAFSPGIPRGMIAIQEFPGTAEVTEITTRADSGGDLGATYFTLNAPGTNYYVWYNTGASVDPAPGGTGIEVAINNDDSAAAVAAATQAAIDGEGDFSATIANDLVTVTNATVGDVTDAADGGAATSFTFFVRTQGADAGGLSDVTQQNIETLSSGVGGGGSVPEERIETTTKAEVTQITTVADSSGSLDGLYFILYDDVGSVAFWIDIDDSGTAEPAHGADRSVEITTIATDDDAATVANKVATAVDGDSKFSATDSSNVVTVTDASTGPRSDGEEGTSGFSVDVLLQGATGITGTIDGVNDTFTLIFTPNDKNNMAVYVDGLYVNEADWVLSGKNIIFTSLAIPAVGQDLEVKYTPDPLELL